VYSYKAYGLNINSALPLPELITSVGVKPDLNIKYGSIPEPRAVTKAESSSEHFNGREAFLSFDIVGRFAMKNGDEIVIDPLPGVEENLLRLPLLGAVMATILHQRGKFILHASSVDINGRAVAFAGDKGQGKSTMTGMLNARGHRLIADDIVALETEPDGGLTVVPGGPNLKLYPDAIEHALGAEPESLPRTASILDKRVYSANSYTTSPMPFRCLYILADGDDIKIEPMGPQEMLVSVIGVSYMSRFGTKLLQGEVARAHFLHCTHLCKNLPVFRLQRPRDLSLLIEVAEAVESHVLTLK
jgi:hypothetical protein